APRRGQALGCRPAGFQGMRAHVSPGTGRRYPFTLICQVLRVPRSSVYAAQVPLASAGTAGKRGPKTRWTDAELVAGIRAIVAASPFHGVKAEASCPENTELRCPLFTDNRVRSRVMPRPPPPRPRPAGASDPGVPPFSSPAAGSCPP